MHAIFNVIYFYLAPSEAPTNPKPTHYHPPPECATGATSMSTHPGDLEELQSILHFPEEVALRITDAEYQLFYKVHIQYNRKQRKILISSFYLCFE